MKDAITVEYADAHYAIGDAITPTLPIARMTNSARLRSGRTLIDLIRVLSCRITARLPLEHRAGNGGTVYEMSMLRVCEQDAECRLVRITRMPLLAARFAVRDYGVELRCGATAVLHAVRFM